MKKIMIIVFVVIAILAVGLYLLINKKKNNNISSQPLAKYSMTEVSKHNSVNDCWLVINSKVYDVSSFISKHPGGDISGVCGTDASSGFFGKHMHSQTAQQLLQTFLKGEISTDSATIPSMDPNPTTSTIPSVVPSSSSVSSNELKIEDLKIGTGAEAIAGKTITVNYLGTLTNGTKFDSSYDRNTPFTFNLGAGQVIEGWEKGFNGMKVGGKRKLTIPPQMGYGSRDMGTIPANSTLIFEVELLAVK